jgi:hypothetical protein
MRRLTVVLCDMEGASCGVIDLARRLEVMVSDSLWVLRSEQAIRCA